MTLSRDRVSEDVLRARLADLPGWQGDRVSIARTYDFPEFLIGVEAVREIAAAAEEQEHHPDIDIRWRTIVFTCSTHSVGGTSELDFALAAEIHRISTSHGAD